MVFISSPVVSIWKRSSVPFAATSTFTTEPSLTDPLSISSAIGSSMYFCIALRSGRAPYCLSKLDLNTHLLNTLEQFAKRDADDLDDILFCQRMEDDRLIDTIEEFRVEESFHRLVDLIFHLSVFITTCGFTKADLCLLLNF